MAIENRRRSPHTDVVIEAQERAAEFCEKTGGVSVGRDTDRTAGGKSSDQPTLVALHHHPYPGPDTFVDQLCGGRLVLCAPGAWDAMSSCLAVIVETSSQRPGGLFAGDDAAALRQEIDLSLSLRLSVSAWICVCFSLCPRIWIYRRTQ